MRQPSIGSACRAGGFTLIELITVIVILGLLSAFALLFTNLEEHAEEATVASFVGALRSAHTIAFSKMLIAGAYRNRSNLSLFSIVRCDRSEQIGPNGNEWGGHYIAIASLRESVFSDPEQQACNGNEIEFTTRSGRTVTITHAAGAISWTASPAF
jgi:prepilin-type N-terminal cleavage/methylation domain-containing protein